MDTAYRFDDSRPPSGAKVNAFRTLSDLKRFVGNEDMGAMQYWEITGLIVKDEGGPDGILIKVKAARRVY